MPNTHTSSGTLATATENYCTVAQVKAAMGITDTDDDSVILRVVGAVSRGIDGYCGRRFYVNSVDETRTYTEQDGYLFTDDIVSITTLKVDYDGDRTYETTWSSTDYDLLPENAATLGQPYTCIERAPNGRYTFSTHRKGQQIIGKFGWASVPDEVTEAAILQSQRTYKRKDAPFGVLGSADMGQLQVIPKLDPDVQMMLRHLKRVNF